MKSKLQGSSALQTKYLSKNQFVICLATCLLAAMFNGLKAQNSNEVFKEKYEKETLLLDVDNNKFVKNKEKKKIGFSGKSLKPEFESVSPESKEEFLTFRKRSKRGKVLLIAGGTVFVTALVVAPFIVGPVFAASFGSGIGAYYVGVHDVRVSRRHLNKAIWLRNRDVLAKN